MKQESHQALAYGSVNETLEIDGNVATKIWERREWQPGFGTIDEDFSDQFEELYDEDVCDDIFDKIDNTFLVADIEDLVREHGFE